MTGSLLSTSCCLEENAVRRVDEAPPTSAFLCIRHNVADVDVADFGCDGTLLLDQVRINHAPAAPAVILLILLIRYNETAFPVDYRGENGQR